MAGRPQNRAASDPLTRLYSRGFFYKRLRQEIDEARRKERSLG